MHECDPVKRALKGKRCESPANIQKFFLETVLVFEILTVKPSLTNYTHTPIVRYWQEIEYTTKPMDGLTHASEIYLKQSKLELEDDIFGVFDFQKELEIMEWYSGVKLQKKSNSDPLNAKHMPMIRYWNLYLSREQNAYFRVRYNVM